MHVLNDRRPLTVVGAAPGVGVSALLANWYLWLRRLERRRDAGAGRVLRQLRVRRGAHLVAVHCAVGAAPNSADWASVCRYLIRCIGERFEAQPDTADRADLPAALQRAYRDVPSTTTLVVIIDGADRLDDVGDPDDLWWCEPRPPNVRLVCGRRSTTPSPPGGAPVQLVTSLNLLERQVFIARYLDRFGKQLPAELAGRTARLSSAATPRMLEGLLQEFRIHGRHDTLSEVVDRFSSAASATETLFGAMSGMVSERTVAVLGAGKILDQILERLENDHRRPYTELVPTVLGLLWCSRQGLSERDLLALAGALVVPGGGPVELVHWSVLRSGLEPWLVLRGDRVDIDDPILLGTVERRYLSEPVRVADLRHRIAEHFQGRPAEPGAFPEVVWQLETAGAWQELYEAIRLPPTGWEYVDPADVIRAWRALEQAQPDRSMVTAYAELFQDPAADPYATRLAMSLLYLAGHAVEAADLERSYLAARAGLDESEGGAGRTPLASAAEILHGQGRLAEAAELLDEQEELSRVAGDADGLDYVALQRAALMMGQGRGAEAEQVFREVEARAERSGNLPLTSAVLAARGLLAAQSGDHETAVAIAERQEELARTLGDPDSWASAATTRGVVLIGQGRLDDAVRALVEAQRWARRGSSQHLLAVARLHEAVARIDRGERGRHPLDLLDLVVGFARRCANHMLEWQCLTARAIALQDDDPGAARDAVARAVGLARNLGSPELLVVSLRAEAEVLVFRLDALDAGLLRFAEAQEVAAGSGQVDVARELADFLAAVRAELGQPPDAR